MECGLAFRCTHRHGAQTAQHEGLLLAETDAVAIRETRGTQKDLSTLPNTHRYVGTLVMQRSAGISSECGTILGISERVFDRTQESEDRVHRRGRATTWSVRTDTLTRFTFLHLDLAESMRACKQLLFSIHGCCALWGGRRFPLGDFNFVVAIEARMQGDGALTYRADHIAHHFEVTDIDCCELMLQGFVFRRLAREVAGGATLFSRIDRIYN